MRRNLWDLKVVVGLLVFVLICLLGMLLYSEDAEGGPGECSIYGGQTELLFSSIGVDCGWLVGDHLPGMQVEIHFLTKAGAEFVATGYISEDYTIQVDEQDNVTLWWRWEDYYKPIHWIVPTRTPTVVQPYPLPSTPRPTLLPVVYPLPPTPGPTSLPVVYPMAQPRR